MKPLRVDGRGVVRFLSTDEESRLRATLAGRDERRRCERLQANAWRLERGYSVMPKFGSYTDHLTPLILLALNTGLRRGELFRLRWSDVDAGYALLIVRAESSKNAETRHVPLNAEAAEALRCWGRGESVFVFPSPSDPDRPLEDIKSGWLGLMREAFDIRIWLRKTPRQRWQSW